MCVSVCVCMSDVRHDNRIPCAHYLAINCVDYIYIGTTDILSQLARFTVLPQTLNYLLTPTGFYT